MNWQHLNAVTQLQQVIEDSHIKPVLIFKHSTRCSISSAALDRLDRQAKNVSELDFAAYFLDLIRFREVSNAISEQLGVYHQSPQAILIHHGKVIYEESHFSISYQDIEDQVKSLR